MRPSQWALEEEVVHLRATVQQQQRRIAELVALVERSEGKKTAAPLSGDAEELWCFGYGSLVWNPGPIPWVERRISFVRGFSRAFRQPSTDHRGTPAAPGRVVTLLPASDPQTECYGVAYRVVGADRVKEVVEYLHFREKDNYEARREPVFDAASRRLLTSVALVYVGRTEGLFAEAPLEEVARHIAAARGPSGSNAEYAANLQRALAANHVHCEHVFEVVARLLHL